MRLTALALMVALSAPVQAQIYKCSEGGRTVFKDRPCDAAATPMAVRPAAGHYDEDAAQGAELRAQRDKAALAEASAERARRELEEAREEAREAARPKPLDRCDQLRADFNRARKMAATYSHPINVERELSKARHAQERSFWECSPGKRISAME